jgi:peptidyl-prolyl cis-trans isomerase A (cyclophilin A)
MRSDSCPALAASAAARRQLAIALGAPLVTGLALAGGLAGCRSKEPDFPHGSAGPAETARPRPEAASPPDPARLAEPASPAAAAETLPPLDPALLPPPPGQPDPQAPERYVVRVDTTKGTFDIEVTRAWAPRGADRFYDLVRRGLFDDVVFFRVVAGFVAQVGIPGDPRVAAAWRNARIEDDPVKESNRRGTVTFATSGPNSRVNQIFINLVDNPRLDTMGFAPFGRVRDMSVVDRLYSGYGEGAPVGRGPSQMRIQAEGNRYLRAEFPELDAIRTARIVSP